MKNAEIIFEIKLMSSYELSLLVEIKSLQNE